MPPYSESSFGGSSLSRRILQPPCKNRTRRSGQRGKCPGLIKAATQLRLETGTIFDPPKTLGSTTSAQMCRQIWALYHHVASGKFEETQSQVWQKIPGTLDAPRPTRKGRTVGQRSPRFPNQSKQQILLGEWQKRVDSVS